MGRDVDKMASVDRSFHDHQDEIDEERVALLAVALREGANCKG